MKTTVWQAIRKKGRVVSYKRQPGCLKPTMSHVGPQGFWANLWPWTRSFQDGPQPCGCTYTYAHLGAK